MKDFSFLPGPLRRPVLLATLCTLSLCPLAHAAEPQWVEVRSPNFSVVTDAGEKRGREVALRFEQMRAAFGTLVLRRSVSTPVPLQIIAFRNAKGLRQVVPLWKGKPVELAGLFQAGEDRNFIALDLSNEGKWEAVFHEYAHMLLNANFPQAQLWFDEGFAEYYATIQIGSQEVKIGAPRESTVYTLQSTPWMKVTDLFSIGHRSREYNESGDRRSIFYAQSWLMTHYLFDMKRLKDAATYFDLVLNHGLTIQQGIRQAFGMDPKKLDDELRRFYRSDKVLLYTFKTPLKVETASTYQLHPLNDLDVKVVLADMHLHSPDYFEQAVREFEEVLQVRPDSPAAHRGLGYASLHQNDLDKAGLHFRRAAQLSSEDPRVQYFAALLMSRQAFGPMTQGDHFREMTAHLEKSIALNPEFADAHNLLALVHLWQREPEPAIASFQRAIELSPRNEHYAANLAQAYVAVRRLEEAKALLQQLQHSTDEKVAANAAEQLERLEGRSHRLAVAGAPPDPAAVGVPKDDAQPAVSAPLDRRPIESLEGRLVNVECSETSATVTVVSGKTTRTLRVADRQTVILIGVDEFDCGWRDQQVVINYRPGGEADGDIATLEIGALRQVPVKRR